MTGAVKYPTSVRTRVQKAPGAIKIWAMWLSSMVNMAMYLMASRLRMRYRPVCSCVSMKCASFFLYDTTPSLR